MAQDIRRVGGGLVLENPDRALEEVPRRPETSSEDAQEQANEEGGGLRAVSVIVAVVSSCTLVGGGAGMLAGVALGAINPFALGIAGVGVGIGLLVLLAIGVRRSWWRSMFGG